MREENIGLKKKAEEAEGREREIADLRSELKKMEMVAEVVRRKSEELEATQKHILKRLAWEEQNPLTPLQLKRLRLSQRQAKKRKKDEVVKSGSIND